VAAEEPAQASVPAEAAAECPEVVARALAALDRAAAQVRQVNLGVFGKVAVVVRARGEAG